MYRKLSITRFFWHLAIFSIFFCCQLMNIFLTQFWTVRLLIHKPQPCLTSTHWTEVRQAGDCCTAHPCSNTQWEKNILVKWLKLCIGLHKRCPDDILILQSYFCWNFLSKSINSQKIFSITVYCQAQLSSRWLLKQCYVCPVARLSNLSKSTLIGLWFNFIRPFNCSILSSVPERLPLLPSFTHWCHSLFGFAQETAKRRKTKKIFFVF